VTDEPVDLLIEAAVSAYRERDADGRIVPPPAWWDLSGEAREELFERQLLSRELERAAHPNGWSTTVSAVLARGQAKSTPRTE
jgi:hypothetical protein